MGIIQKNQGSNGTNTMGVLERNHPRESRKNYRVFLMLVGCS